jgi:single-strand selective monofunctional uracil DNA glycosylase
VLLAANSELSKLLGKLRFTAPVSVVYNPLDYAWETHAAYLKTYGATRKRVVFLGMNPGPYGMAQTGVPFGEIAAVRDWLGITGKVRVPEIQHPKRPINGFDCKLSEVSGRRLWGLFAQRFGTASAFSKDHLVLNYCPLAFMETSGKNLTPDKIPPESRKALFAACDESLRKMIEALEPEWVIGVGNFAKERAELAVPEASIRKGTILHPSPASPAANRDWAGTATKQLQALGIW